MEEIDKNTDLQLEEERRCPRCDGEGVEWRQWPESVECSLCKGAKRCNMVTHLGQQILDFIDKHRGGAA